VFAGASALWPGWVAAVLTLAASALLTGAFHEDGLADYVDGIGGGQTKARVLDIMKDSRIGSYGALALGLVTLLKAAALAQMSVTVAIAALLLAHMLGRACACGVLAGLDYVRDDDAAKARPLAQSMRPLELLFVVSTVTALAAALIWWQAVFVHVLAAAILAALAMTLYMARHMKRRIGGFTGDALGAVEQMVEVIVLLMFAARL
jgi:adenosylcobinamide-GDP ribazoletransferase